MNFNDLKKLDKPLLLFHLWKMKFYHSPCHWGLHHIAMSWGKDPSTSEKIKMEGAEEFAEWMAENYKIKAEYIEKEKENKSGQK